MDLSSGRWIVEVRWLLCQICEVCGAPSLDEVTEWRDLRGQWANENLKRAPICDECLKKRVANK